jgi:hypothetical protein
MVPSRDGSVNGEIRPKKSWCTTVPSVPKVSCHPPFFVFWLEETDPKQNIWNKWNKTCLEKKHHMNWVYIGFDESNLCRKP